MSQETSSIEPKKGPPPGQTESEIAGMIEYRRNKVEKLVRKKWDKSLDRLNRSFHNIEKEIIKEYEASPEMDERVLEEKIDEKILKINLTE